MEKLGILLLFLLSISIYGQSNEKCACSKKDKAKVREYFSQIEELNKFIMGCEQQNKAANQILIATRCEWGGSGRPTLLAKTQFPPTARKLKISGVVKVEIIVDENGSLIYSKMVEGNKIFKRSAERAACNSQFTPFRFCKKPVKNKTIIKFNLLL